MDAKLTMEQVRTRLLEARKKAGYTQQQAAEAIGLSRASSLSDLETGRNEISLRHLLSLCALYGVAASSLFSQAEEAACLQEALLAAKVMAFNVRGCTHDMSGKPHAVAYRLADEWWQTYVVRPDTLRRAQRRQPPGERGGTP
jgi:transcriptional regulator with XRE-family HTH domain